MSICVGVLIDTISIQSYIYGSNRLRENLGASHLVVEIYNSHLQAALSACGLNNDLNEWGTSPDTVKMKKKEDDRWEKPDFEVGFIGGGKTLLLFKDFDKSIEVIKTWTQNLLTEAPNLSTAVAIKKDFNLNSFSDELTHLFKQLTANKNYYAPVNGFLSQGITARCPATGYTIEGKNPDKGEEYVSAVAISHIEAAREEEKQLKKRYLNQLNEDKEKEFITFTNDISRLGQVKGSENHIAVIHADVNGMGQRFKECKSLEAYRKMAIKIDEYTKKAFEELLIYIRDKLLKKLIKDDSGFAINKDKKIYTLPIRPILLAGEDVTFITEGRLGVHLAEKFLEFWHNQGKLSDDKPLYACAGIAIVNTKYPFYRAYEAAEELCSLAKERARENEDSSWLDFQLLNSASGGNIRQIRASQYKITDYQLHFGPYQVVGEENDYLIEHLKSGIEIFTDEKKWPRSVLKDLRIVLYQGVEARGLFIENLKSKGKNIPVMGKDDWHGGHFNKSTGIYETYNEIKNTTELLCPYHDMLELMEFYPIKLIEEVEENAGT